jgi:uncharacterized protein YndB with AHSA1/START domain
MPFQAAAHIVEWRLHLGSPPTQVYELLATDIGRSRFWAESAVEHEGEIQFTFPDGATWQGGILESTPPRRFAVRYIGGSTATFALTPAGSGTDLYLSDEGVPEEDWAEVSAGWVSVLLALKATADFGVDLRNHDPLRSWGAGYAEN